MSLRRDLAEGRLTLTLDRPEARNALDGPLLDALLAALHDAARDPGVRVVVVTGAGKAFSAGGDFNAMVERRGSPLATKERQERGFGALARAILTNPKPIVARVNGDAYGAGAMIAIASDLAYAAETARFGFTFSRVALVPDTGGSFLLPRILGLKRAKELALLGSVLDARRAAEWGLVNEALPEAELAKRVDDVARRLASGPTTALGFAKRALLTGATASLDEALAEEANLQALAFTLEDHAEGVDAALAKREPKFTGR